MLYGVTVSTSDSGSGGGGSNPFGATAFRIMPYGITVAQQVLALLAKVRLLLGRRYTAPWCNGSIPDSGSGGGGSNPSGAVYMEFVAEWFRRKFVALVYAGSNPVKLPETVGSSKRSGLQIFNLSTRVRSSYRLRNASIAQW